MYNTLITELYDEIQIVTVNRPEKLNALNREVIAELGDAFFAIETNSNIKAAILTGAGIKAFVAGADISEFTSLDAGGGKELAADGQHLVFNRIEKCTKPVIAAVNGFALGGGCELAMACHFRVAATNAKFGQPEVNLGLIPGYGGTQRLTQLIGKGKAMELMMTGAMIDAQEALRLGLVNYLYEPNELLDKAKELISLIISKAPLAIAKIIELVNIAAVGSSNGLKKEIEAFGELFGTEDMKEGANAFLEKRKPNFTGK